jgi:UDP-N-acetylglucosamine 2-epimerase
VGYIDMLALEAAAAVIATDSGGVQKEAYFLGKPCVTLRDSTEWTETVEAGWNVLVGADSQRIAEAMRSFRPKAARPNVFGDAHAAEKIAALLA